MNPISYRTWNDHYTAVNQKKKTFLLLASSLIVLISSFLMLGRNAYLLAESRKRVNDLDDMIGLVNEANIHLLQTESGMRGFYIVNNIWYLNNFESAVILYKRSMDSLELELSKVPELEKFFPPMKAAGDARLERLVNGLKAFQEKGFEQGMETVKTGKGKALMDDFLLKKQRLEAQIKFLKSNEKNNAAQLTQLNSWMVGIIGVLTAFLLSFIAVYFLKTQKKIQKINLELEDKIEELDQFARVTSHDLQEPLRMTRSFLLLLEKKYKLQLDEQAREYIYRATDGADRMQKLIVGLLEYSRVGHAALQFQNFSLLETMHLVMQDLGPLANEMGGRISYSAMPSMYGDPSQIFRLLLNLVGNGLKFRKKEMPPEVHVLATDTAEALVIMVKDNGIGIPPIYQEKLFKPFFRIHPNQHYQGSGLGLATCKKIVEMHAGTLEIVSEEGKGSTFIARFPKKQSTEIP
jgi:signal transduction histidine kinase